MTDKESLYKKRYDGREFNELRNLKAKVGVVPSANGSAIFQTGKTKAISVVRGPRTLHPQHMQNPQKGILRVTYNMMSFSVSDRVKPGPSRRSQEISKVTEWALEQCVDLDAFPNTVVDVLIQIPQADAGTRVAGINAAIMALAHAGIPMKEMASAVSVGKMDKTLVLDLDKYEDSEFDEGEGSTDIPVCWLARSERLALLQLDGKISMPELKDALKMSKEACKKINEIQTKALKEIGEEITSGDEE